MPAERRSPGYTDVACEPAAQSAALARSRACSRETRARPSAVGALVDGRAWTAGELARHAAVARSTASEHLDRLVAGGLLAERRQGRHRYVELADAGVAELLEDLMAHLAPRQERPRTFRAVATADALARARTCYDHLAGRLGVAVTDAMTGKGLLDQDSGFALTATPAATGSRRARHRRRRAPHAASRRSCACASTGPSAARIWPAAPAPRSAARFQANGWVRRIGDGRALLVTPTGQIAVRELLGIERAAL